LKLSTAVFGSAPGDSMGDKLKLAALRALRTFLQGVAAAFPAGGAGAAILSTGYWETFAVAVLGAAITALASFLQNVASVLPQDPTQKAIGEQQRKPAKKDKVGKPVRPPRPRPDSD
jgi:hypothetical protein